MVKFQPLLLLMYRNCHCYRYTTIDIKIGMKHLNWLIQHFFHLQKSTVAKYDR